MVSNVFASMGFSLSMLPFLLLVIIVYLEKKKNNRLQNNVFVFLLFLTFVLNLFECFYVYCLSIREQIPNLTETICRIYLYLNIFLLSGLIFYFLTLVQKSEDKEKEKKHIKISFIILLIVAVVFVILSSLFSIEYGMSKNGFYIFAGPAVSFTYIIGIMLLCVIVLTFFLKKSDLQNYHKLPLFFTALFFVLMMGFQIITDYDYNNLTFLFGVIMISLYFTIESQDERLINDLEKAKTEEDKSNKAKNDFLSSMSHEIRTPMNTIVGISNLLLEEETISNDKLKDGFKDIDNSVLRLSNLINNILDISEIESKSIKYEKTTYSIENLIQSIDTDISLDINLNEKDLIFDTSYDPNILKSVYGEYDKVYKILTCFLKYIINHKQNGTVYMNVDGKESNNTYNLQFTITGITGVLTKEDLNIEFDDISISNENTYKLELIIVKNLLKTIDGEIKIDEDDKNDIKCIIKLAQSINKESEKQINIEIVSDYDFSNAKLIYIDKKKKNVKNIEKILQNNNINIENVKDINDCINKIAIDKYDLILMNYNKNSKVFIERIKQNNKNIHIIAVVDSLDTTLKQTIKDCGFENIIYRPFNKHELIDVLGEILNQDKDGESL